MKKRRAVTVMCLMLGPLITHGQAFAHGTEEHGAMHSDARMKKMHAMMPMFSAAAARMEAALERNDAPAVQAEAGKILAVLPDLKKSKPHKNPKQREKFLELATNLEKAVLSTVDQEKRGDVTGARASFKKLQQACAACHAKFR